MEHTAFKKILLLVFLILPILLSAQLTGTITDSESGLPIGFASIGLTKTNRGANADKDGRFTLSSISIAGDDSLVVSCVGYITTKRSLQKDKSDYNIQLQRKSSVLREVIVRSFKKTITLPWDKRSNMT